MALADISVDILNEIRATASTEYNDRIPEATRTNITSIGNYLMEYSILKNEFLNALVTKIGLTIVNTQLYENSLAGLKSGNMLYGDTVEEIFVELMKAEGKFNNENTNVFGNRKPTVDVIYHRKNRQDMYAVSISDTQLRTAFRSGEGVATLVQAIFTQWYNGMKYDEYVLMKNAVSDYLPNMATYQVESPTSDANNKKFLKTVKKARRDMSFMKDTFNKEGKMTFTNVEDMVLLLHKDVEVEIAVDTFASLFNIDQASIESRIIIVDDFGEHGKDVYGVLADKNIFKFYDNLEQAESIRNPTTMTTNFFVHVWQTISMSGFKNCIKFEKKKAV